MAFLDIQGILDVLPHRYPFLLVDRIESLTETQIVGIKNVTVNEPCFTGHFPDNPVFPGVLIVEALAQVAGVMVMHNMEDRKHKVVMLAKIEEAKFIRPVRPGDQMRLEITMVHLRPTRAKMTGIAFVDGQKVAEAALMCVLRDKRDQPGAEA
ncbi:MAG: 3-hydroxyacyl-ACP dehydratase FabZ [Bryobacterales bacterium]|nr:3-hydroxyacyl-ACP dehydratase FabZ [Bryobacterales bacterium]